MCPKPNLPNPEYSGFIFVLTSLYEGRIIDVPKFYNKYYLSIISIQR